MNIRHLLSLVFLSTTFLAAPAVAPAATLSGTATVSDGDTVTVSGARIRLNRCTRNRSGLSQWAQ